MIDSIEDLELEDSDKMENIDAKLKEKLNISIIDMKKALGDYVVNNSNKIGEDIINIAPYSDYSKLIEEPDQIAEFLSSECSKPETWDLVYILKDGGLQNMLKFKFMSNAVDEGQGLVGIVLVNYKGKINYAFVQGTDR